MDFNIGDTVRDINHTWVNYNCTGVVTSINGNNVTWRDSKTGNLITDVHQDLEKVMAYNRPINNSSGNQTDRKRSHKRRRNKWIQRTILFRVRPRRISKNRILWCMKQKH